MASADDQYLASYVAMALLAGQQVRGSDLIVHATQILMHRYTILHARLAAEPLPGDLHRSVLSAVFPFLSPGPFARCISEPAAVAADIRRFERRIRRIGQWLTVFRRCKAPWDELFRKINKMRIADIKKISGGAAHNRRSFGRWLFIAAAGNPRRAGRIIRDGLCG